MVEASSPGTILCQFSWQSDRVLTVALGVASALLMAG